MTKFNISQYFLILLLLSISASPPIANMLSVILTLLLITNTSFRNSLISFFFTLQGKLLACFILIIVTGAFYSKASFNIAISEIWGWRKILLLPLGYVVFLHSPDKKKQVGIIFVLTCSALAILSIFMYFVGESNGIIVRNHSTQGLFFSVAVTVAFILLVKKIYYKNITRYLLILSIPLLLANIAIITESRSSFVALTGMLTIILIFERLNSLSSPKNVLLTFASLVTVIACFALTPSSRISINTAAKEFYLSKTVINTSSVGLRIQFLQNTFEMIPQYYLIGAGTAGFQAAYQEHIEKKHSSFSKTGDPHNQYLKILIEYGIIGLTIFLCLIFSFFRLNIDSESRLLLLCPLSGWLITSLANSHFSTFNEGWFIWLWLGIFSSKEKS
ncbi:MAG: hypothetical protein RLY43_1804 [Bacteroidota bacterium]|jgi:O-antigen ligase